MYKRYMVVAGGEFRISKKGWSLLPSVMFQKQGPNFEALFGTFVRYAMTQKKEEVFALDFGAWYFWLRPAFQPLLVWWVLYAVGVVGAPGRARGPRPQPAAPPAR